MHNTILNIIPKQNPCQAKLKRIHGEWIWFKWGFNSVCFTRLITLFLIFYTQEWITKTEPLQQKTILSKTKIFSTLFTFPLRIAHMVMATAAVGILHWSRWDFPSEAEQFNAIFDLWIPKDFAHLICVFDETGRCSSLQICFSYGFTRH